MCSPANDDTHLESARPPADSLRVKSKQYHIYTDNRVSHRAARVKMQRYALKETDSKVRIECLCLFVVGDCGLVISPGCVYEADVE